MSTGYPFCDSDCPSVVTSSYLSRSSVLAYLMFLIMSVTPLCFRIQSVLFLSLRVSYHDSLHLPVDCDQFLKLGVAK